MTVPQNAVDHVRDLGASSVEQVHSSWHSAAQHPAVLVWYLQAAQLCLLAFQQTITSGTAACDGSTGAVVSAPHTYTMRICPVFPPLQMSWAYFLLGCLLQDFLHPLGGRKEKEDTHPVILQSAFSPPEQPLCRDNAPTVRSLGKISLSHVLFAIVKELLGFSWARDLLLCSVAKEL